MMNCNRREFVQRAVTASAACGLVDRKLLAGVVPPLQSAAPATTAVHADDPYRLVDPELIPALKQWPQLKLTPELLAQARKLPLAPPLPAPAPQPVEKRIPGGEGAPDVHITIVDPNPGAKGRPVLLHTHGGGMVLANTQLYPFIQNIAEQCHCVVVSVDYRMAPETRFPGSLEDNYAALKWVHANADALGIDPVRIAVGGESAGGGHAAMLAIHARDKGEIPIFFQLLIYPMLDDRTGSSRPAPPATGHFIWNAQCNEFGWTALLGVPAGSAMVPPGSVPSRVQNLAGLPPAWIGVGSIDLFVDEDIDYGRRLLDAGVSTEIATYPGAYHGFDLLVPSAGVSKRFTESWQSALRRAFATQ